MMQFVIAAPRSGSGKTTVTCALLAALKKRGHAPCAFKSGPDYIDPMFHRAVLGVESHNLDLYLSGKDTVQALYARYAAGHGAAVCEGAMGFYDGQGLTTRASAWELADTLNLPVLLVVQPKGASVTLAAQIQGLVHYRTPSHLAGILLNDCSEKLYKMLAPLLERETGLPVLGYLPHLPEAVVESRHLGLKTAAEIDGLQAKIEQLAEALAANLDWEKLAKLTDKPSPEGKDSPAPGEVARSVRRGAGGASAPDERKQCSDFALSKRLQQITFPHQSPTVTAFPKGEAFAPCIAVAQDEAFCFAYAETLDALRDAGAELCFFSPVHDAALPEGACGLYLPGGYPELYAKQLSENTAMLTAIRQAVEHGLPTAAECGGFLYLGQTLEDPTGTVWPMAGVLPGSGVKVGRLVRFGYAEMMAKTSSMLFRAGERLPIHEFHHWDSTDNGTDFSVCKNEKTQWECGFASGSLYAGFPHLYWAGTALPRRFVQAAERYHQEKRTNK